MAAATAKCLVVIVALPLQVADVAIEPTASGCVVPLGILKGERDEGEGEGEGEVEGEGEGEGEGKSESASVH